MTILPPPLQTAMRLIEEHRPEEASAYLLGHLHTHPDDDRAWYLMAYLSRNPRQRLTYLRQCLRANPGNQMAKDQLDRLIGKETIQEKPANPMGTVKMQDRPATVPVQHGSTPPNATRRERSRTGSVKGLIRFLVYALKRGGAIAITIILGVFLTILIINQTGQVDNSVLGTIKNQVDQLSYQGYYSSMSSQERMAAKETEVARRAEEAGLNLPDLPRNILWTFRFLTLNWGEAQFARRISQHLTRLESDNIRDIILAALPNTLLLMAAAYLVIFLLGIPLALYLSRHNDTFIDRFFSFLSPLSSIPSWVIGILLVLIFAVQFQLLPINGMLDNFPPATNWGYLAVVARHMVLPVLSIVISLFFQLVYTWRTYFLLFSEEDYVELAVAKGLPDHLLHRRYILRPGIPYVITSFAMTFVSFWQTTTALEVIFQWPGIGYTYIKSLPHFFGESMFPGDLLVAVAIVVIFAYLLGFLVFLLDILYAIVDPRIRIGNDENLQLKIIRRHLNKMRTQRWERALRTTGNHPQQQRRHLRIHFRSTWKRLWPRLKSFWQDLVRYPSAVVGLAILVLFILGSIYAVIAYPYQESGRDWYTARLTGQPRVPRLAKPAWTNVFRKETLPETIILDSAAGDAAKEFIDNPEGSDEIILTYTFDYPYGDIPQDILVYYDAAYEVKKPFATVTWVTPNGMEYIFRGGATETLAFDLKENISMRRFLQNNPEWNQWYDTDKYNPTSPLWALFAYPNATTAFTQKGTYQVVINILLFEEENDVDAELILIGQVYGLGGTDFMRRDLMFPLLWGLPYVILLGLFGAVITTLLALIVAAIGVWFGGWVDNLIQRITEANMILPILAIAILIHVIYGINMTVIIIGVILMNVFSTPTKTFRSAFLQIKDALYIEAAQVYGASNLRLIFTYMIPRVLPVIIPQLVILIPGFIFLEATFGLFNIRSMYPTWGRIIYEALQEGAMYGSPYWVLEPLFMLLLTSFTFTLLGSALDRVLNPRLKKE